MHRLALMFFLFAAGAAAQTTEIGAWQNGSLDLTQGWRIHAGDDIAWKQTDYDDSAWPIVPLDGSESQETGAKWYRLHLRLPSQHGPLALLRDRMRPVTPTFPISSFCIGVTSNGGF